MVKQIEEFRPELYSHLFADVRSLEHGEIKVVNPRAAKVSVHARFGTCTVVWRIGETAGIKPLRDAAATSLFVASRNHVRPDISNAEVCCFQRCRARICDLKRKAALEGRDAIDSPARNNSVGQSSQPVREFLPMTEGQVQDVADYKTLRNILRRERPFASEVIPILHAS